MGLTSAPGSNSSTSRSHVPTQGKARLDRPAGLGKGPRAVDLGPWRSYGKLPDLRDYWPRLDGVSCRGAEAVVPAEPGDHRQVSAAQVGHHVLLERDVADPRASITAGRSQVVGDAAEISH